MHQPGNKSNEYVHCIESGRILSIVHPLQPQDFPRTSDFPWAWTSLVINPSLGMYQEIHTYRPICIVDSVKINISMVLLRECFPRWFVGRCPLIL